MLKYYISCNLTDMKKDEQLLNLQFLIIIVQFNALTSTINYTIEIHFQPFTIILQHKKTPFPNNRIKIYLVATFTAPLRNSILTELPSP